MKCCTTCDRANESRLSDRCPECYHGANSFITGIGHTYPLYRPKQHRHFHITLGNNDPSKVIISENTIQEDKL